MQVYFCFFVFRHNPHRPLFILPDYLHKNLTIYSCCISASSQCFLPVAAAASLFQVNRSCQLLLLYLCFKSMAPVSYRCCISVSSQWLLSVTAAVYPSQDRLQSDCRPPQTAPCCHSARKSSSLYRPVSTKWYCRNHRTRQ